MRLRDFTERSVATQPVDDDTLRTAWQAVKEAGDLSKAARTLALPRTTLQSRIAIAMRQLGLPDPAAKIIQASNWTAYSPPPLKERTLDELKAHRRAESERNIDYENFIKLVRVDIKTPGPIGLMIFGDPHVDNPGCDFNLLEKHIELAAARKDAIFCGNIGDLQDNWIGRLERLYAESTIQAKEVWKLVEWMMHSIQWAWLIRGNHDLWSGRNDPLDWISKSAAVGVDQGHGVRIAFKHPNNAETRLHARHDFSGNSIYNPLHALKKEVLHGFRDHIIAAGHRHIGADARDVNGDGGVFVMLRVSGYKVADSFRHQLGLKAKPLHPAGLVIVDPEEPEHSPNRVWVAPTVEEGAAYLDWKRSVYENGKKTNVRKTKAR